jgi:hypothetical protein
MFYYSIKLCAMSSHTKFNNKKFSFEIYIYIKTGLKLFFTIVNEEKFDKKMFCNIYKNLVERNRIVVKKNDKMSLISGILLYIY